MKKELSSEEIGRVLEFFGRVVDRTRPNPLSYEELCQHLDLPDEPMNYESMIALADAFSALSLEAPKRDLIWASYYWLIKQYFPEFIKTADQSIQQKEKT